MLLIADETKPVALAGVMGGQNSEIKADTKDVLIESAWFKPQNVRATSKRLELRTESSYRFERGADIGICDWASRRAAQLILETAGGKLAEGAVEAYPKAFEPKQISLRHSQTNALLGIEIAGAKQIESLQKLGLEVVQAGPGASGAGTSESTIFQIPSFRVDLKREVDLIEEVVRIFGIDKVPSTPPRGAIGSNSYDSIHDQLADARRLLCGLGLFEAQGQTLISEAAARLAAAADSLVPLANPLSGDMNVLRPSLLPGLLEALRHNLSHRTNDVALFELGRVFLNQSAAANPISHRGAEAGSGPVREERRLAIALTGKKNPLFWSGSDREAVFDSFDLKGIIEEFFEQFGVKDITYNRRPESGSLFVESATIQLGKFPLGEFGQLLPPLAKRYDLRDPVLLGELNLDILLARRNTNKNFKALPSQPSIRRDVAMLVPESTTHDAVLQAVRQSKPGNLESVELFDVFRGKNVPAGQKSLAYAFTYRNAERSLTDAEVNAAHEKVVAQLRQTLSATIRDN
jgi:phenylalanyl-tRNA synthetase beta chain